MLSRSIYGYCRRYPRVRYSNEVLQNLAVLANWRALAQDFPSRNLCAKTAIMVSNKVSQSLANCAQKIPTVLVGSFGGSIQHELG